VCEEGEKTYTPCIITPESFLYFYERTTWDEDLDPDLTDLLEVQFEPEQEKDPSQRWLNMEVERNIPVNFATKLFPPSIFVPNTPVLQMDW
jgi:hypothetical protein